MQNQFEQQLSELFSILIATLIDKLKSGTANHQELEIIRKLLADNGITAEPKQGTLLEGLETLPFESEDEAVSDEAAA